MPTSIIKVKTIKTDIRRSNIYCQNIDYPIILFLHMQKTAGMTLQELLRRHHGPNLLNRTFTRLKGDSPQGLQLKDAIKKLKSKDKLFMGHFCYGIHRHIPFCSQYITFFRDPIKRLISLYYYSHSTPEAHYYQIAKDKSIEEFLMETKLLELDNGMTRLIAGDSDSLFINQTPFGKCDKQLLQSAKQNLDTFSFVGIQEEFNRSVMLLSRVLEWSNPYYVTLNVRKRKSNDGNTIYENLLKELRNRNWLDIELYEYAKLRFETDYENEFLEAGDALKNFKRVNKYYQALNRPILKMRLSTSRFLNRFIH